MVEIKMEYLGDLRIEAVHGPSGARILTDAPVDNSGKGESFSPTDLVGTALGTCLVTIMAIAAEKRDLELKGTKIRVVKTMAAAPQRRIGHLAIEITNLPASVDDKNRAALEAAARSCPVTHSVHADTKVDLTFTWNG
jgi:putative redox protein